MKLTEVRFHQPGFDFRGKYCTQLSAALHHVELCIVSGGVEVRDEDSGVVYWVPGSMIRQSVTVPTDSVCPQCGKDCKSPGGLANHTRIIHPEAEEPPSYAPPTQPEKPAVVLPKRKRAANG